MNGIEPIAASFFGLNNNTVIVVIVACAAVLFVLKTAADDKTKKKNRQQKSEAVTDASGSKDEASNEIISDTSKYLLKNSLLTNREQNFFDVLSPVAAELGLLVAIKPRLADFITVNLNQYEKGSGYFTYFNQINKKHVDFLLCEPLTTKPIVALELDDKSHQQKDRIDRDEFVNKLYEEIGLPVLRIERYNQEILKEKLQNVARPEKPDSHLEL